MVEKSSFQPESRDNILRTWQAGNIIFFLYVDFILFLKFWLHWVFVAAHAPERTGYIVVA